MKKRTILSLEQALSMSYATLRFAHLGWRIIRLEATPQRVGDQPGDPNRYIGRKVAESDRHAYFVAPNVGKEAVALNLKTQEGQAILKKMIRELDVDVFCCNTIPSRYENLGIDYETLSAQHPDLIWAGISAMGPDYPDVPGYDPMIQAMAGYMEVTGQVDGPPTLAGIPIIDLKAGDEVYANVLLALIERQETGLGKRIDVSMLQAASSWLITMLPLIDMDCAPEEIARWGNAHRKYIPTNVYATCRGHIYIAVGSNAQWQRLTETDMFRSLGADTRRSKADFRYADRERIYGEIGAITERHTGTEISQILQAAKIPHARINSIREVHALEAVRQRMTKTHLPDGRQIQMQPMAVDLVGAAAELPMAPRYGEHSVSILKEIGYSDLACRDFLDAGIVAAPPTCQEV